MVKFLLLIPVIDMQDSARADLLEGVVDRAPSPISQIINAHSSQGALRVLFN
jgi:hypothetical protein